MKTLNLFVTLILVAILVTACGSAAPTPTSAPAATAAVAAPTDAPTAAPATDAPTAAPAKSDVTLTYMASQDWIMDAEQALGKKFEEQTGIHIDYQIIPSDQYFQRAANQTELPAKRPTSLAGRAVLPT